MAVVFHLNPKEFAMNEVMELEVVDLGDATEVTMGMPATPASEPHPTISQRPE